MAEQDTIVFHRHVVTGDTKPMPVDVAAVAAQMEEIFGKDNIVQQGPIQEVGLWVLDLTESANDEQRRAVEAAGLHLNSM